MVRRCPKAFAQQLSYKSLELYSRICARDFIKVKSASSQKKAWGSSILNMTRYCNFLTIFVKVSIMAAKDDQKAECIEWMIRVAEALRADNDYCSLYGVCAGLGSNDVYGFVRSIDETLQQKLRELSSLFIKKPYKDLRALQDEAQTKGIRCVPWLGVTMGLVASWDDSSKLQNSSSRPRAFSQIATLVADFLVHQGSGDGQYKADESFQTILIRLISDKDAMLAFLESLRDSRMCTNCNGKGNIRVGTVTGAIYDMDTWTPFTIEQVCTLCGGEGRVTSTCKNVSKL